MGKAVVKKHIDPHVCVCNKCNGSGYIQLAPSALSVCPHCEGSGRVIVESDITTYVTPYKAK